MEHAFQVGVHELVPVLVGGVFNGYRGRVDASAVKNVVDGTELFHDAFDEGGHLLCIRDVDIFDLNGCSDNAESLRGFEGVVVIVTKSECGGKRSELDGGCTTELLLADVLMIWMRIAEVKRHNYPMPLPAPVISTTLSLNLLSIFTKGDMCKLANDFKGRIVQPRDISAKHV